MGVEENQMLSTYYWNQDKCITCKVSRHKTKNVRLFRFPKYEKRCKQWVLACQLEKLLDVPAEFMYKRYRLCSQHFTDEDYTNAKMNRLKPTACPSKFDFGEKSMVSKLKESLKNKLSKSVKDYDGQFSGEIIDVPRNENMMDSVQVLTSVHNEKTNFVETESEYRIPGSSVSEPVNSEVSSNKFEINEAVLLDISMNERFYSPEQRKVLTNCVSKSCNSQSHGSNIPENNIQSKEKLNTESTFKALKKQWLEAEIKAATAKRDYYEMKRVMLTKLQNDLDFENSSNFQISSAIRYIKVHLNKEELTSKIEKKKLKQQQLEEAKILVNNCEIEYCEAKLEILSSSDEM